MLHRTTERARVGLFGMLSGVVVISLAALPLGGCTSDGGSVGAQRWQRLHDSGRYAEAADVAADEASSAGGERRVEAWYRAGVSSLAAGDFNQAERWLLLAAKAERGELSGRAWSTLGIARERMSNHRGAAEAYDQGAELLTGDDRAKALVHAGAAWQRAGDATRARDRFRRAGDAATSEDWTRTARQSASSIGYTVQLGAFSSRRNAERAADEVRSAAIRLGYGEPLVRESDHPSRRLYLVQVGEFPTTAAASAARLSLARQEAIVVVAE